MEKKKKNKTLKEQYKSHKRNSKILYATKPVITMTPLAITMGVKADEWFGTDWKVATGGTIAIIIMGISALLIGKKTEDKSITNTWITLIIGWYAVAFIFMLLSQIMTEIWWVMLVAGTGMLASAGVDYVEKDQIAKADKIKVALEEADKDTLKEQALNEIKQEKEKQRQATE